MWREIAPGGRFALINVWRSIDTIILCGALAVCYYISEARGPLLYELQFLVAWTEDSQFNPVTSGTLSVA
jgi:hypothetical protein